MDGINNRDNFLRFQITCSHALLHPPPNFNVGGAFVSAFSFNSSFVFFRQRPDLHELGAPSNNIEIGGRKLEHVNRVCPKNLFPIIYPVHSINMIWNASWYAKICICDKQRSH